MIETKGLSGGEAFLRLLAGMGVERIFASPGSEWSPVWEYLAKPYPQAERIPIYLSTRHEETAMGMASGYAKATGKLPAVMIHTTVGSLHATMAMRGALHEQVPMVVFSGESFGFGEEEGPDPGGQWLRHLADIGGPARLVERCAKWSFTVNTKAILPATIQRACQIAMAAPRGPVFISLPMEILFDTMTANPPPSAAYPTQPAAEPKAIAELAGLLAKAKNPVVVTEEAGRSHAVVESLIELAELVGLPVVETRSSGFENFPRSHPLHGGFAPKEYLAEADLLFFVGAVAPWHPASTPLKPGAKLAALDDNPIRTDFPYWGYPVDLCLTGEVEVSLELLLSELKKHISPNDPSRSRRKEELARRSKERKAAWEKEALAQKEKKPIDTRWVMYELNQILPADAAIVEETITHRLALHRYVDRLKAASFFAGSIGGLGTGLSTALGVKAAWPKRPVLALMGDGSLNYNPVQAALGCAQEHGLPILIILFNNHGYLSMKSGLPRYYPEGWAVRNKSFVGTSISPSPDYALIARAFEGHGEKVEEPADVRPALERGLKAVAAGQLALIDIRLEPVTESVRTD